MEYERIHKVQSGTISPSKLGMKLMWPHNNKKKGGSNSNSSRTSPSRLDDTEFVKDSLLDPEADFNMGAAGLEVASASMTSESVLDPDQVGKTMMQPKETMTKEKNDIVHVKGQQLSKNETGNLSAIHPLRTVEDENLDYDSNASSSSFEFHKERSVNSHLTRSLSRPMSSKWNDAEKWIMSRQNVQPNSSKKNMPHNQANRMPNMVRVAPESTNYDTKSSVGRGSVESKRMDLQVAFEKFSFIPTGPNSSSVIDQSTTQLKDLNEVHEHELSCTQTTTEDKSVVPVIRSVCMRDMGTEMTPVTSVEPSRTATPVGATTPLRSPTSSIPSTPRRSPLTPTPTEQTNGDDLQANSQRQMTEQELKEKTRKEILALGVKLGKMNIAAWASKEDQENNARPHTETYNSEEVERIENEKRAVAWEEAEKSKHAARYKREEIKIQAWESQQKAKLEAEMRRIEVQVEQMRAQAQAKMVKKIAMARQKSEEKRAMAEARKSRDAERTAVQAEYIRQTGRMPSSHYICCGWM